MKRWIALAVAVVLVGAAALVLPRLRAMSDVGAGFVARQMCSCIFVGDRSVESCRPDMLPEMDSIEMALLPAEEGEGVRAWVPLLAERVARHRAGSGCTLEP